MDSECHLPYSKLHKENIEPFSSCFGFADLQNVDCLGELTGAPGAAAELTEDLPGLEPLPLGLS
jgi:hypothetical protein